MSTTDDEFRDIVAWDHAGQVELLRLSGAATATYLPDAGHSGQVYAKAAGDGWMFAAHFRSDISPEDLAGFAQWLRPIVTRLLQTSDTSIDGWFRCSPESAWDWRLTCRTVELPHLD